MPEIMRNGWGIRAHALFLDQLEAWIRELEADRARAATSNDPQSYRRKKAYKLAAVVRKLMLSDIPSDPLNSKYRHGGTANIPAHIFRAKFGQARYRLFYQAKRDYQRIIYMWVNSEDTLRTYGSKTDAYVIFSGLIENKVIPPKWEDLNKAIGAEEATRLTEIAEEAH